MKPYGIISDTHCHNWSSFATTLETGINSRLDMTLRETRRCAAEVKKAGGSLLVHAGDLFHVRGSIAPSVLNPTLDCYRDLIKDGFQIVIDAGNHDLEGKDANRVSSAITAFEGVGCRVVNRAIYDPALGMVIIPWHQSVEELKKAIECVDASHRPNCDLILHAPIDGVILGIPDHGLSPEYLAELGFKRVFSGHYHHHKHLYDGDANTYATDVYSIGALTHLTWGDIGTKAGFLVVSGDGVKWFKSHAPEFVEITEATDPDDIALLVDGNYVRAKINSTKEQDVQELRKYLTECGAKGVVIMAQKEASVSARTGATVSAGASIEVSVADFIKTQSFANPEKLAVLCQSILTDTRSAA